MQVSRIQVRKPVAIYMETWMFLVGPDLILEQESIYSSPLAILVGAGGCLCDPQSRSVVPKSSTRGMLRHTDRHRLCPGFARSTPPCRRPAPEYLNSFGDLIPFRHPNSPQLYVNVIVRIMRVLLHIQYIQVQSLKIIINQKNNIYTCVL